MKIVVFTGSGISAESGLDTFRTAEGLWNQHNVQDVATPEGYARNPAMVRAFYASLRKKIATALPNAGHKAIAEIECRHDVTVITQNVDDLHERAGSSKVIHLHGELSLPDIDGRPDIVFFGEATKCLDEARKAIEQADRLVVVGTSLRVYPAAGLLMHRREDCDCTIIDPDPAVASQTAGWTSIVGSAGEKLPGLKL